MKLSVHDNILLSYSVLADKQKIHFHTEFRDREPPEFTDIMFDGVIGYHFERDNFQTIIFDIDETDVEVIYAEDRELFETGRKFCWPGPWNKSDESVLTYLIENEIKGFYLSSSLGMVGWVLAKSMRLVNGAA